MKNVVLNEFIRERIKENQKLFTKKEMRIIENNEMVIEKIYLLGAINFNKI